MGSVRGTLRQASASTSAPNYLLEGIDRSGFGSAKASASGKVSYSVIGLVRLSEPPEDRPESDVDVLVEFSQPVGMQFIRLAEELQAILGRKVDLVSRGGIKPGYYDAIREDLIDV